MENKNLEMIILAGKKTGTYTGNEVHMKHCIDGTECSTTFDEYYPDQALIEKNNPEGKGIIVLFMGGPCEYRHELTGFPACLSAQTGQIVVNVAYPGSLSYKEQTENNALETLRLGHYQPGEEVDVKDVFDWEYMADEVNAVFDILTERHSIDKVVCHSFGIVPLLCKLAKPEYKVPFTKLVMIEPYWNIRVIETDEEFLQSAGLVESVIGRLGEETPVEGLEGPFEMFQHPMKQVLHGLGVTDVTLMFAEIESNYYTKKIQAQRDTLFKDMEPVILKNVGHGLNMKNVAVERYGGLTYDEIAGGVINVLERIAEC